MSALETIKITNDWNVVDQLVAAGLATRKTYKNLMSHTEYKIKEKKMKSSAYLFGDRH